MVLFVQILSIISDVWYGCISGKKISNKKEFWRLLNSNDKAKDPFFSNINRNYSKFIHQSTVIDEIQFDTIKTDKSKFKHKTIKILQKLKQSKTRYALYFNFTYL